ncbi:hypothetical protein GQ44DRAFT_713619 [Phaeosphaeriaceae sp. PMI808]|nr:hypothetical protein GQ44DRAFT_713619 [Phaeosphaeriaceae sp. PMI808]
MRLLDLPPEVLDLIIEQTLPDGLESFVLSCKSVYVRATSQILQHNELKKRWAHTDNVFVASCGDALGILYEISYEPIIAQYIKTLNLWTGYADSGLVNNSNAHTFREDESAMDEIRAFLRSNKYYTATGLDSWWQEILAEGTKIEAPNMDQLCATVALLALLPNIKSLQLPDQWHEVRANESASPLVPYLESLVALSNASSHYLRPLGCLETILPFVEEGYDTRVGLQCLQPFIYLKSIRNLYVVSCVAIEDDWSEMSFNWPNPLIKSPLTRIEMASCCMDAGGLSALLSNTPVMTTFRYSHQTKWDGLEYDWNPGELLEAIANYHGHYLKELAITIDELHGEIINGLSSFMRFATLEKIEVDVRAFCGPPLESGQRHGRNAFLPEGATPWTHLDIPCMGDMLPVSIRELHVNTDFPDPSQDALMALFKNIKDRSMDRLTLLKKTIIRQYRSDTARVFAENINATFEMFDADCANPRPRSMMPQWKRDFSDKVGGIVITTTGE